MAGDLSAVPFIVLMLIYGLGASLVVRRPGFFHSRLCGETGTGREPAIDGLRGVLALGVFFHHVAVTYHCIGSRLWMPPPELLYARLGPYSVTLFFFITGYLFWSRALRGKRTGLVRFLEGRARRTLPAYIFSVLVVTAIILVLSGFRLRVPPGELAGQIARWLMIGFPLGDFPDLNGVLNTIRINAGVAWTLRYEWIFYLLFPALSWFATGQRGLLLLPLTFFFLDAGRVMPTFGHSFALGFAFGMLAAVLKSRIDLRFLARSRAGQAVATILVLAVYLALPPVFSLLVSVALFLIFLSIVYGNAFWGLLELPGMRLLGTVSYSLYLLHGIVLYLTIRTTQALHPDWLLRESTYWPVAGLAGALAVATSLLSYRYVEYPLLRADGK